MIRLLAVLALVFCASAYGQTMVLACPGWWGASDGISPSCTGCSKPIWTAPDAADEVKTDASQYWAKLGSLASTAKVITSSGKAEGSDANCADSANVVKTIVELSGTTSTPPPPPVTSTGNGTVSWTTPIKCADQTAATNCAVTGWLIEYGQGDFSKSVTVGAGVLTYTFTGIATGTWQARVTTLAGTQKSAPSNAVSFTVTATTTGPPPPPPPAGPVVVAVVSGLNMSPIFGITSTGKRGTTVLGFVPVGTPCLGSSVYSYRSQGYFRFDSSKATWWSSKATSSAAVACK